MPLLEIFFQVESDFNGIFVNLKPTTERQEATNITCSSRRGVTPIDRDTGCAIF